MVRHQKFRVFAGILLWLPFALFLAVGIWQSSAIRRNYEREVLSDTLRFDAEKLLRIKSTAARLSVIWRAACKQAIAADNISTWHKLVSASLVEQGVTNPCLFVAAQGQKSGSLAGDFAPLLQMLFADSLIPMMDTKIRVKTDFIDLPGHLLYTMPRRDFIYSLPLPENDWWVCQGLQTIAERQYSYILLFEQNSVDWQKAMGHFFVQVQHDSKSLWKMLSESSAAEWRHNLAYWNLSPDETGVGSDYRYVYQTVGLEENLLVLRAPFSLSLLAWEILSVLALVLLSISWLAGFARIERTNFPVDSQSLRAGLLLFLGPAIGLPLLGLLLIGYLEMYSGSSNALNSRYSQLSHEIESLENEFRTYTFSKQHEITQYLQTQRPFSSQQSVLEWCEQVNSGRWNLGYLYVFTQDGKKLSPTWFQFRPTYTYIARRPEHLRKWFLQRVTNRGGKIEELYQSLFRLKGGENGLISEEQILSHLLGPDRYRVGDKNDPVIDKLLSGLATSVCRRIIEQRSTAVTISEQGRTMSVMAAAAGVDEEDYVNETMADLGKLTRVVSGSEKIVNYTFILSDQENDLMNFLLLHWRAGHFTFALVLKLIERARADDDGSASYFFNRDVEGLDFASKTAPRAMTAIANGLENPGECCRFIAESQDGTRNLYLLKCSEAMEHLVIARSRPLASVESDSRQLAAALAAAMLPGTLWIMLGIYILRRFLLQPVGELETAVEPLFKAGRRLPVINNAVGELLELTLLFGQVKEGLDQLNLAHALQEGLFPTDSLSLGRLRVTGRSVMMEQVGGDFYDYFVDPHDENHVYVCIGDVTGHGLAAAVVVAMISSAIPLVVRQANRTPQELLTTINQHLLPILKRLRMSSIMLMRIDSRSGDFALAGAGHPALIHVKPEGDHDFIELNAFPLGATKSLKIPGVQKNIGRKSAIVFYTDGWVEALLPDGEMIGYKEFARMTAEKVKNDDNPIEALYDKLEKLTGTTSWGDDVSIVLLEFD
ncbi:MAG: hypothetical protein GQF41_4126 [Candidatus Rifleibacterium amylolyticum]|nr:MAG: hypothetical protein GQF41_4126 [Candidatus Rifleibacterium amylolyticum]